MRALMMRTRFARSFGAVVMLALVPVPALAAGAPVSGSEAKAIATDAYAYAYPLVLMELSRRVMTNAGTGGPAKARAPMNQFAHLRAFPDATFTDVVKPNADTLYSSLWFDVSSEPLVIAIPDAGSRYYLFPMLDMWTDVFASPGTRTTGNGAQTYALTGPGWTGTLPAGVERIAAPTNVGWIIGRVRADGAADLAACHAFQDGLKAVPLSQWGKNYVPPPATYDTGRDMTVPADQLLRLQVGAFFKLFTEVTAKNPPHPNDYPILQRMARVGLVPGRPFDLGAAPPEVQTGFQGATMAAASRLFEGFKRAGIRMNGWRILFAPMGTYGTDYLRRQVIAYSGLGANVLEDAFYPSTIADSEGKPLEGAARYLVHLPADQLPPVNAFWSLTLYDEQQLFVANTLNRFAIGDRDPLGKNADGSLDLYLQHGSPGPDKERNWLPTPAAGRFALTLRLYWPKPEALDGTWSPPPVVRTSK
jgi:hypothetical protein